MNTSHHPLLLATIAVLSLLGCADEAADEEDQVAKQPAVESQPANPNYYFDIYGTDPDDGPGAHFPGACVFQDDHENLLLFSMHSPGHRNGGSKGGSNPPRLDFGRSMRMHWLPGLEGTSYQAYKFDMSLRFERNSRLVNDTQNMLTEIARVRFGASNVPVYRVEKATNGVLPGYHAWFRILKTNQPPYTAGLTGTLFAHLRLHKIGRTIPDNDPWTDDVLLGVFESFYTQACFVDYLNAHGRPQDTAVIRVID
ncbi:MAG: hypothetical protein AAF004_14030 [Pseudomonadota bacterium]